MKCVLISFFFAVLFFTACTYDKYEDLLPITSSNTCDTTVVINYSGTIQPIIIAKCQINNDACHSANPTISGLNYTTYDNLGTVARSGKLVAAITHTGPSPMPRGLPKLDDFSINKIIKWVNAGAPNN